MRVLELEPTISTNQSSFFILGIGFRIPKQMGGHALGLGNSKMNANLNLLVKGNHMTQIFRGYLSLVETSDDPLHQFTKYWNLRCDPPKGHVFVLFWDRFLLCRITWLKNKILLSPYSLCWSYSCGTMHSAEIWLIC